jgi:hypothetical protein
MNKGDIQRVKEGDFEHARRLVVKLTRQMPEDHIIRKRCEHLLSLWDTGDMPPPEVMQNVGAVVGEFITSEQVRESMRRIEDNGI